MLIDTIHLEHENRVQRCIGATILTSDAYRYLQYKELEEQAPCTAASRCFQHHILDKIWWDVSMFGYLWPLTSTSECVGSVAPVQSAAEVGCCCIHKSQSKGVRGQQLSRYLMCAKNLLEINVIVEWHKWIRMANILHNLLGHAWTNWPPPCMKSVYRDAEVSARPWAMCQCSHGQLAVASQLANSEQVTGLSSQSSQSTCHSEANARILNTVLIM